MPAMEAMRRQPSVVALLLAERSFSLFSLRVEESLSLSRTQSDASHFAHPLRSLFESEVERSRSHPDRSCCTGDAPGRGGEGGGRGGGGGGEGHLFLFFKSSSVGGSLGRKQAMLGA